MKDEMTIRYYETLINGIAWFPVLIIGLIFFIFATGSIPDGSLLDFRIKLPMAI